jgi:hypothetical protein
MAINYKVLGQSSPTLGQLTDIYTVPSSNSAVVSTITVCNRDTTNIGAFRIAVRPAGEAISSKHYISYDTAIPAVDSISLTIGITLAATDVVSVYAANANVSFNVFGSEIY